MKKLLSKITKNTFKEIGILTFITVLTFALPAYAEPNIVSNTSKLLNDASKWVLGLIPVAAGLMIGYHSLCKMFAQDDPHVIAKHNHAMKNILIGSAIGLSAAGIVSIITSYY